MKYLGKSIFFAILLIAVGAWGQQEKQPNVILIITDDQGYGDLGATGNHHIKSPVLDAFASSSIRFNNFYVSPVCAPTRSSLMTGRYSLRTGVRDTYNGGAIMSTDEITLAELLKGAGYATGLFGKWHLGDNYPSRPMDQGFDESLMHLSGGMGQVGDFTTWFQGDRSYFDPVLWHNGKQEAYQGYCSDIFADNAIDFISRNAAAPFFCYLSFNAPHTPLQVPERYYNYYKDTDPSAGFTGDTPFEALSEKDKEDARKVYAMVSNIDDNIGRLFQKLEELKIVENTLIIFMTDNGPQQVRYVAGMRGRKGSVYRGGTRVPFYLRLPNKGMRDLDIDTMAAHIDVLPTVAALCGVALPTDRVLDGRNLLPLLHRNTERWDDRMLFSYWTRKYPEPYRNMAIQNERFKLVGQSGYHAELERFELFDLKKDPFEQHNLVLAEPKIARQLRQEMEDHYSTLIQSENLKNPPRIHIGTPHENPIVLNRNDAGGDRGIWAQEEVYGKWSVAITEGTYKVTFKFIQPLKESGRMVLETGGLVHQLENDSTEIDVLEMVDVSLPEMTVDLIPFYQSRSKRIFPFWVSLEKTD